MTLPSTPSHRGASLPALNPSDSPFSSPRELTPNSKVKALLAAIDDSSDNEQETQPCQPDSIRNTNQGSSESNVTRCRGLQTHLGTDEDESDEAPIVPRGRLAARLQGHSISRSIPITSKVNEVNETPYDRIRNQCLQRAKKTSTESLMDSTPETSKLPSRESGNILSSLDEPKSPFSEAGRSQRSSSGIFLTPKATNISFSPQNPILSNGFESVSDSESDLPAKPQISNRLQILVARKKEERRIKEAVDAERNAEKRTQYKTQLQASKTGSAHRGSISTGSSSYNSDDQAGDRRLTPQARPTRKASKKALEEMNRETQRMSRNMQLAHQARTKKKITKESFFTRFNFGNSKPETAIISSTLSSSTIVSSMPVSDADPQPNDSPPTSPHGPDELPHKMQESGKAVITVEDVQGILPDDLFVLPQLLEKSTTQTNQTTQPKKMIHRSLSNTASPRLTHPSFRVHLPKTSLYSASLDVSSDSDLEIVPNPKPIKSKFAVFERHPVGGITEERSLQNLRALAHMNSPANRVSSSKQMVTMSDMQTSLQQRARKQAAAERAEKIQCLKDRGVIIQSAEERQKDQAEVEDLVERARREANTIMEKEKNIAKKQKILNGNNVVTETTSEDEDYQGNDADQSDMDFSGSDEEDVSGDEQQDDESEVGDKLESQDMGECEGIIQNEADLEPFIDIEASENGENMSDFGEKSNLSHDDPVVMIPKRRSRASRVIVDDNSSEDDETRKQQPLVHTYDTAEMPLIPDFPFANAVPMGMTQAFAATMADTQTQDVGDLDRGQDLLDLTEAMPRVDFTACTLDKSHHMILDSQRCLEACVVRQDENKDSMDANLNFSQRGSQEPDTEDGRDWEAGTQYSEIPDPTQDVGFIISPIKSRFVSVPPSTVDTVLLSGDRNTPVVKRKGRLRRGTDNPKNVIDNNEDTQTLKGASVPQITADAFDVLKKAAARKPASTVEIFDKTKSYAKGLVEEQAQESEDEYAGLGGASDDESAGEEDEEVRKMIEEGEVEVDERELAAFYANKERVNDEKAVGKLFKDLNNGGLRRKRGAEFDLSDSDDDVEARQRAKRKEFARMRKALLENENVGKIAEDPKKLAFLRAIEDRDDDGNLEFLEEPNNSSQENLDTQEIFESQLPNQTATSHLKRKRPLEDSLPDAGNRLPPLSRRTRSIKKPSTLAEIRASVSFLIEEPHAPLTNHQPTSSPPSSDNETTHEHNDGPFAARRHANPVIDRLSLKRAESAAAAFTASRLAFHHSSANTTHTGFKAPNLMRRATTSQLLKEGAPDKHGISTLAVTERAAGGEKDSIKRGGTRKSSIGYFARERDAGKRVEVRERKRMEELKRVGRQRSGLGVLATGTFE